MVDVWVNSMVCHARATCHIAGCCHMANSMSCHPRATCHIAGCCHLVNLLSWFQSQILHCRVLPPGEFNDMSSQSHVSLCRVLPFGEFTVMIPEPNSTLQGAATWGIQWHVIPEPRVTLQGRPTATWWIYCHDPRATCHIAGCCHLVNSLSWFQSHMPHCRVLPLGEFTVVIPVPRATLQGAVTFRNQCHDRATLQGVRIPSAILKIVFRHILFCVLNAVWALTYRLR